jgi:hypothetical protein
VRDPAHSDAEHALHFAPLDMTDIPALARRLRASFPAMVQYVWRVLDKQRNSPLTYAELHMAWWIAHAPGERKFVFGPRGIGKSYIGTTLYPDWLLLCNPGLNIRILSENATTAAKFYNDAVQHMSTVPAFQPLVPRHKWQRNTEKNGLDVGILTQRGREPSLVSQSAEGQLSAGRHHVAIADDLETLTNCRSQVSRDLIAAQFEQLEHMLYRGTGAHNLVLGLGTYNGPVSVYPTLWKNRKFAVYSLPLFVPDFDLIAHIPGLPGWITAGLRDGTLEPGQCVNPLRFGPDEQASIRAFPTSVLHRQYMGVPNASASAERPIRLSDLIVHPCASGKAPIELSWGATTGTTHSTKIDDIPIEGGYPDDCFHRPILVSKDYGEIQTIRARIDHAGTGEDEFAWAIGGHLGGKAFIMSLQGVRLKPEDPASPTRLGNYLRIPQHGERITRTHCYHLIAQQFKLHSVRHAVIERNNGGDAVATALQQILNAIATEDWHCGITDQHHQSAKHDRILSALESPVQTHQVVIDPQIARCPVFQQQASLLTPTPGSLPHDDRIEAFALLVGDLAPHLHSATSHAESTAPETRDADDDDDATVVWMPRLGGRFSRQRLMRG